MSDVKEILNEIRQNGDKSVLKYNVLFDKNSSLKFRVTKKQIKEAYKKVDEETLLALKYASKNITRFAKVQMKQVKEFDLKTNFGILSQKVIPVESAGCYVPGGNYPLPSTALMTIIPAKVAGVKRVVVCSPKITPLVIVASDLAGADEIYNVGGVGAIGAMAYGTKQIKKVDKIVGPGNKYVAEAKKEVYGSVGIDFIAGPSEVLIVADDSANPKLIAADLLAQAEHDINAKANLITTSKRVLIETKLELKKQLSGLPTKIIAEQSIKNSKFILVKNFNEAIKIANEFAPEHLEIQAKIKPQLLDTFNNYGSMFFGECSAESFGDYCLGPNHTLPTSKASRYTGGLSVRDFVKIVTIQKVTKFNKRIIWASSKIAGVEGLFAHKKSAELRKFC